MNGSIIHSWAKQQDTIADSSGESEFIALVYAAKEVMYIRNVLEELGIELKIIPNIFIDSTVAIDMIKNNLKGRVKHLDRKYFWVRNNIKNGVFTIQKVLGTRNLADIFTKYVDKSTLEILRPAVMGRENPPINPPSGVLPHTDENYRLGEMD